MSWRERELGEEKTDSNSIWNVVGSALDSWFGHWMNHMLSMNSWLNHSLGFRILIYKTEETGLGDLKFF